jgi:hypothetical protein
MKTPNAGVTLKIHPIIPPLLLAIYVMTAVAACGGLDDPAAPADPDGEIGTTVSELAWDAQRTQVEGDVVLSASAFGGFTDSRTIGGPCRDGTKRDNILIWADYVNISSSWSTWGWVSTDLQDCTAVITMNVGPSHWDHFHWRLYTRAYDLAVGATASQHTTLDGAGPDRAIDGNPDGNWWHGSVTHTVYEDGSGSFS